MMNYKDLFYMILEFKRNDVFCSDSVSCNNCNYNVRCDIYRYSWDKVWKGEY